MAREGPFLGNDRSGARTVRRGFRAFRTRRCPTPLAPVQLATKTIALATGKTETWVSDRTGHDGHTMIDKYRRKARTWNVGELGRLDQLIPELRATAERKVKITTALPLKLI